MRIKSVFAILPFVVVAACSSTGDDLSSLDVRLDEGRPKDPGGAGPAGPSDDPSTPARLPDPPLPEFSHDVGSGLKAGIVTGRIYDDLAKNTDDRMADLAALGTRALRLEIETATPLA